MMSIRWSLAWDRPFFGIDLSKSTRRRWADTTGTSSLRIQRRTSLSPVDNQQRLRNSRQFLFETSLLDVTIGICFTDLPLTVHVFRQFEIVSRRQLWPVKQPFVEACFYCDRNPVEAVPSQRFHRPSGGSLQEAGTDTHRMYYTWPQKRSNIKFVTVFHQFFVHQSKLDLIRCTLIKIMYVLTGINNRLWQKFLNNKCIHILTPEYSTCINKTSFLTRRLRSRY